ncbi:hypothetical protein [Streptomyces sp. NPDC002122]|uniref:hypothetical protein n=1 Tax=Streptomyces sp. NPDC002122 TaxID=3154407 RepID=UPI0033282F89
MSPTLSGSAFALSLSGAVIFKRLAAKFSDNQDTKIVKRKENRMVKKSNNRIKQWIASTCDSLGDLMMGFAGGAVAG